MMSYYDFIMTLECIAVRNDLRLIMNRAPFGCGIFFYFIDSNTSNYSKSIVWMNGKENPEVLFDRLQDLADRFKGETE